MSQPWDFYCTTERVFELHRQAIEVYKGDGTVATNAGNCVERCLAAAVNAESYADAPKPGLAFAGYALYYFTMNHCFTDGNKRVGWLVALDVLATLGLTINAELDEVIQLFDELLATAEPKQKGTYVAEWLAPRLRALS
jgi:prophage maintenance system killer protein